MSAKGLQPGTLMILPRCKRSWAGAPFEFARVRVICWAFVLYICCFCPPQLGGVFGFFWACWGGGFSAAAGFGVCFGRVWGALLRLGNVLVAFGRFWACLGILGGILGVPGRVWGPVLGVLGGCLWRPWA